METTWLPYRLCLMTPLLGAAMGTTASWVAVEAADPDVDTASQVVWTATIALANVGGLGASMAVLGRCGEAGAGGDGIYDSGTQEQKWVQCPSRQRLARMRIAFSLAPESALLRVARPCMPTST
jgi:hypothetical protein